jgi:cell division transport system permease protein
MNAFHHSLAATGRALRRRPLATFLAVLAVLAAVYASGLGLLLSRNAQSLVAGWDGGAQMVVYLHRDLDSERAERIGVILRELPAVEKVVYVSAEQALVELTEFLGGRESTVSDLEAEGLSPSFAVTLREGVRDVAALHPLVERLKHTEGIEDVELAGDWVDRLGALVHGFDCISRWLLVLFGAAGMIAVWAALRLALAESGREVHLLRLVGASALRARGPVLLAGALVGSFGAGLAIALLLVTFALAAGPVADVLQAAVGNCSLVFLPWLDLVLLLAAGAGLGALAGAWAGEGGDF